LKTENQVLHEARRLYALGFAIHWLRPKSKIPLDPGWSKEGKCQPRDSWKNLSVTFCDNLNVGVRLGNASKLSNGYLAILDLDVKSDDPRHLKEALKAVKTLLGDAVYPVVLSGRGGGSRHFYCVTTQPIRSFKFATSEERVKVHMPSAFTISRAEKAQLTHKEIMSGLRLRAAWEIGVMSEGVQVVLPPSIHPDSGKDYQWETPFTEISQLPVVSFEEVESAKSAVQPVKPKADLTAQARKPQPTSTAQEDFKVEPVDLGWLDISKEIKDAIIEGTGVTDASAYLLKAINALLSADLSHNEILTILTDPNYFLGDAAYRHAGGTTSRKRAARWVRNYCLKKVLAERTTPQEIFGGESSETKKLSKEQMEAVASEFASERPWEQDIERTQQGKPVKSQRNVFHILSNSVAIDVIRRDEFCHRDFYEHDTPWGAKKGDIVKDDDIDGSQLWLGRTFEFEPSKVCIESAFINLARSNSFDPLKTFLNNLPEWDGIPRLDTWLRDHFGAAGDKEYLAQVFRKWMVAMIMRGYEPGAKFDWMPIFEGKQGVGKSSFGRLLVGNEYFLDWLPNLHDKDAALALQGRWGVEMGELSQFGKNELETIKAFITRTVDKVRPPYGKRSIESPRRCVFFGTTNRVAYLLDETGNRRFKPVEVGALDFKALARDRLQLYAEAKMLWFERKETEITLEIAGRAKDFELSIQKKKMVQDDSNSMQELFLEFLDRQLDKTIVDEKGQTKPVFDLNKFSLETLFIGGGPLTNWRLNGQTRGYAAKMLRLLGGEVRGIKGRNFWRLPTNLAVRDQ
jgi:predicted P-loop ATPase